METGFTNRLQHLEDLMNRATEAIKTSNAVSSSSAGRRRTMFRPHNPKLDFPRFSEGDPTNWLSKVHQFFSYQKTPEDQKIKYTVYHLENEANEWWQSISKVYEVDGHVMTWALFEEELWNCFGPTECVDFDEALSKIHQTGSLCDYQSEFERLQNKVFGWTQKALVGTFIGVLNPSIADEIQMFCPKSLKEAIMLARMMDEQISRQRHSRRPYTNDTNVLPCQSVQSAEQAKKLSWDVIQCKQIIGLCFSFDERFTSDHKCRKLQLLLMEGIQGWDLDDKVEREIDEAQVL